MYLSLCAGEVGVLYEFNPMGGKFTRSMYATTYSINHD